jgi:predicted amidohydrolase YtcJ
LHLPAFSGNKNRNSWILNVAKNNSAKKISRRKFLEISTLAAAGVLTGFPTVRAATPTADLVFINGKIITVDAQDSIVEGVAVRGGRIIDTGTAAKISGYIGTSTKVVDLQGKTATPGLIDSHAHLPPFGLRENGWFVKLQGIESKEEIREMLAQKARKLPKGQWVSAWGIEDFSLSYFDKEALDKVTKEHPLLVVHTTGQWGFANSLALRIAGVDGNTKNPPGSRVEMKFFGNEPTGALVHYPALELVRKHMPVPTDEQAKEALLFAANLYAAEGVTAVHDNFFMLGTPFNHKAYFELVGAGKLPVRIKIWPYFPNYKVATNVFKILFASGELPPTSPIKEMYHYKKSTPELFSSMWGGFKLAIDGVALWYNSPRGIPLHKTEDLHAMVKLFHQSGQQISIHAAGDMAVDIILNALEASLKEYPRQDHRHRIEHAIVPQVGSLERIKRLGVVISTHPQFIYSWGDKWRMKNAAAAIPLNSYRQEGIPVALGADPPAFPLYQPQTALWQAIKRTTKARVRLDSAESISIQQALRMQTMGSAYAGFQEKEIGSIEIGKLADMAVWDRDFYSIPIDEIRNVKAVLTLVGGKIIYERQPR